MIRSTICMFLLLLTGIVPNAHASYGYYVGKNLTVDGSVLLGGTGEEPSSHWLEIVPRQSHAADATISVGATASASLPARLIEIPQVRETFRYITMNYTSYAGFPAPITNGGLNEYQVAIRDIWSPSRDELVAMTPEDQTGPNYSDLARIALERAETARQAVQIIGALIDEFGYTTYGGNSHLIADANEGWVVLEFAGGQGLWVAERLGADDIRVSYPGYIEDVPADYSNHDDWMGSPNLIAFAIEQGWYDPDAGKPFNVDEVYGLGGVMRHPGTKHVSPRVLEEEFRAMVPVTPREMMAMVRDPRIADDHAGYGQVAHLRENLPHPDLALLWIAPTGSVTAPFVPWWIGTREVPAEYGQHRYLTEGSGPNFINPDFQLREATEFAGRVFKRLMYYTCAYPEEFLDRVQGTLQAFEDNIRTGLPHIERAAALVHAAGESASAQTLLTRESHARAAEALSIGRDLLAGIGTEVRLRYGIPLMPRKGAINDGGPAVSCLVGADPDRLPAEARAAH
ncbi:MAG: C69 family dipeptidase [Chromatocurvus sp.]